MKLSPKTRLLNFFRQVFQVPLFEQWLRRRTRARPPNAFISKLTPNPYQYRKPSMRIFHYQGIKLSVDISDYLGHYYYFGFQDRTNEALFSLCEDGFTVIDIGANIGFTALKLAQRSGTGKVFAFEPDPHNFEICVTNIELNDFKNLQVFNTGLGRHEGTQHMEVRTPTNRGGNRINDKNSNGTPVSMKKLDDVLLELSISSPDLIKIDVEGYELKVLQGSERTLNSVRPALFVELDDSNLRDQGDSASSLLAFLRKCGYHDIVRADDSAAIDEHANFANCHYDIIAR